MSIYFTGGCHDCEERIDLAPYSKDSAMILFSEWVFSQHKFHNVTIVDDISTGWEDQSIDRMYSKVQRYKEVEIE